MRVIKPPEELSCYAIPAIFLAGSIEMGTAVDWQKELSDKLSGLPVIILSPRRDDWDPSWEQKKENPKFYEQVNWELDAIHLADLVVFYFAPGTKSPISLMELGIVAKSKKVIVLCPEGFWRKGNVDIVCERFNIPTECSFDEIVGYIKHMILTKP